MAEKIIIIGAVGNCIDILDTLNDINALNPKPDYICIGFLDDDESKWNQSIFDMPVLGGISTAQDYKNAYFINGIGSPNPFKLGRKLFKASMCLLNGSLQFITRLQVYPAWLKWDEER